jgi:hypothetical protein
MPLVLAVSAAAIVALEHAGHDGGDWASPCTVDPTTLTAPGCSVLAADTAAAADPVSLWGELQCAADSRQAWRGAGGDPHPAVTGAPQGNDAYRELSIVEGDDFAGQRCELGENEQRSVSEGGDVTFQTFHEGERKITFVSYKLLPNTPIAEDRGHQGLLQMKQGQPSDNGGHSPILTWNMRDGEWRLIGQTSPGDGEQSTGEVMWRTPAIAGVWARVAFDVTYSQHTDRGRIKVYIDANGDGDALDPGEQSPEIATHTLKYETPDPAGQENDSDGLAPGESIPSHLRVGLYQDEAYDCSIYPGSACGVAVDNVAVVAP